MHSSPLFAADDISNRPPGLVRTGQGGCVDWMLEWLVGLYQSAGAVQTTAHVPNVQLKAEEKPIPTNQTVRKVWGQTHG